MAFAEDQLIIEDRENIDGLKETGYWENGKWSCVCSQCTAPVLPNRGQGSFCTKCAYDFDVSSEHDQY